LDCVHFLQREKIRTVSEKIKFLFSVRGIRLVFWDEQAAADLAISSTRAACAKTNPILITGSPQFAGEILAHLNGEPAAFEKYAQ
jgi:hypothetical protein